MGEYLKKGFETRLAGLVIVKEIRGQGLLIGIELNTPCAELAKKALDKHMLINVTAERVIRLLPPLILQQSEADLIIETVSDLITDFAGQNT